MVEIVPCVEASSSFDSYAWHGAEVRLAQMFEGPARRSDSSSSRDDWFCDAKMMPTAALPSVPTPSAMGTIQRAADGDSVGATGGGSVAGGLPFGDAFVGFVGLVGGGVGSTGASGSPSIVRSSGTVSPGFGLM